MNVFDKNTALDASLLQRVPGAEIPPTGLSRRQVFGTLGIAATAAATFVALSWPNVAHADGQGKGGGTGGDGGPGQGGGTGAPGQGKGKGGGKGAPSDGKGADGHGGDGHGGGGDSGGGF